MRTHQKFDRTGIWADVSIDRLPGLSVAAVETLTTKVKEARKTDKKDKALRSIARELRLWNRRNGPKNPVVRRDGGKVSEQTGIPDVWIVATV